VATLEAAIMSVDVSKRPFAWGGYLWSLAGILVVTVFPVIFMIIDHSLPQTTCALAGPANPGCTYGLRDWIGMLGYLNAWTWMLFFTIPLGVLLLIVWGVLVGLARARYHRETAQGSLP
jgi:hypothetical protein